MTFTSLYQLLHSQVYRSGLNYEFPTLKFLLINEGESNGKLLKIFAGINLRMTPKKLHALI